MKIPVTVEYGDNEYIDNVVLIANPRWEDDSYDDAYGTVKIPVYPILDEDVSWNESLYSTEQNALIKKWVEDNQAMIEEKFCKQLEEDSEPDF